MTAIYRHQAFSPTLSTYYGVKTFLPITLSPLLYQTIRYGGIDYDRNYDGGSSDLNRFVIAHYCIS